MIEIRQTDTYSNWFAGLRDGRTRARINARIRRLSLGNPGDVKPVGKGVYEMWLDFGSGYRLYYTRRGEFLVILLVGGDKDSQRRDIRTAQTLAENL